MDVAIGYDAFSQELQRALRHLRDYVYLENNPLCPLLCPEPPSTGLGRAQELRRLILEAIDRLVPPTNVPADAREWRGYHILTSRYIEGRDVEELMQELAISQRQFYRDHARAVGALGRLLWSEYLRSTRERAGTIGEEGPRDGSSQTLQREAERVFQQVEVMDLREVVEGVLRSLQPVLERRHVDAVFEGGAVAPQVVVARTLLRQVLIQVLSRMLASSAVVGLRLSARRKQKRALIELTARFAQDAGHALGESLDLQAPESLVGMMRGTWLGTSMTSRELSVRFLLPTGQPRVVLAVEDNPSAVQLYQRYTSDYGFQVVGAGSGADALRLIRDLKPDVIMLDIMLPRQDGWEVLQALRADPATRETPILVASVLDESALASSLGANGYLKKPFSQTQLVDALRTMCVA